MSGLACQLPKAADLLRPTRVVTGAEPNAQNEVQLRRPTPPHGCSTGWFFRGECLSNSHEQWRAQVLAVACRILQRNLMMDLLTGFRLTRALQRCRTNNGANTESSTTRRHRACARNFAARVVPPLCTRTEERQSGDPRRYRLHRRARSGGCSRPYRRTAQRSVSAFLALMPCSLTQRIALARCSLPADARASEAAWGGNCRRERQRATSGAAKSSPTCQKPATASGCAALPWRIPWRAPLSVAAIQAASSITNAYKPAW